MIKLIIGLLALNAVHMLSLKQVKTDLNQTRSLETKVTTDSPKERQLFLEEANMPQGNVYTEQLQNTSSNLNEMQSHSRRQTEMKQVGQWFSDVDERLDDFRDAVSRKLNELHMALQRPKVPMFHQFGGSPFMGASQMVSNPMGMSNQSGMSGSQNVESQEEGSEERRRFRHL